jgi:hypothetical protein
MRWIINYLNYRDHLAEAREQPGLAAVVIVVQ